MSEGETRAGFVAVIGAPNAGKSTLVNALVGQKVAIVSPKAQTTRARLMGIAIEGPAQILLVDTPGIFEPKRRLDRAMVPGPEPRTPTSFFWSSTQRPA
jgi:GTP-binding protein Era